MKSQQDVEQMLAIVRCFGRPEAVRALEWVLDLYPVRDAMAVAKLKALCTRPDAPEPQKP